VPPAAGICISALAGLGAKTIVPSGPQLAPRERSVSQSLIGEPPLTGTFRISPGVTKPTHVPSGEKNGW